MARILLIDDDVDLVDELQEALEKIGHAVTPLESADGAPDLLACREFDVVLLDNKMPGMSGTEFLAALQEREVEIPVILMTGCGNSDTAMHAVELGAFDYLEKPDDYPSLFTALLPMINKAVQIDWRPSVVPVPGATRPDKASGPLMLGKSERMVEMYKQIARVARSQTSVIIQGETGTGKELVALAIHTHSPRKNKPFVVMDCTGLQESTLNSELFGHEKGAFTGADKLHKGRFEYAHGGTLFVDEVGEMPLPLQAKLLGVLERQEIMRMGSNEPIKVDVRVVSATHRNLEAAVRAGTFREDLFFRLNGMTIWLPPLRERGEDLQLLTNHFIEKAAESSGRRPPILHPSAWEKLRAHSWPGNIRELRNVLHRAALMVRGHQILPTDLDLQRCDPTAGNPSARTEAEALAALRKAIHWAWSSGEPSLWSHLSDRLESELLRYAMIETNGNKSEIARRIGMVRNTVIDRVRKYGLE
jgi:DNA-binding NtrC family response regulator